MEEFWKPKIEIYRREPWSSGLEWRLMFEGLWVRIPNTGCKLFHIDLLWKLYCLFEKTEMNKKRSGMAHLKNRNLLLDSIHCIQHKEARNFYCPVVCTVKIISFTLSNWVEVDKELHCPICQTNLDIALWYMANIKSYLHTTVLQ